jgi:hypothetical protein
MNNHQNRFLEVAEEAAALAGTLPQVAFQNVPEELAATFDRRNLIDTASYAIALVVAMDLQADE